MGVYLFSGLCLRLFFGGCEGYGLMYGRRDASATPATICGSFGDCPDYPVLDARLRECRRRLRFFVRFFDGEVIEYGWSELFFRMKNTVRNLKNFDRNKCRKVKEIPLRKNLVTLDPLLLSNIEF